MTLGRPVAPARPDVPTVDSLAEGWTLLGEGVDKEVAYIWPTLSAWKGQLVLFGGDAWQAGVTISGDGGRT